LGKYNSALLYQSHLLASAPSPSVPPMCFNGVCTHLFLVVASSTFPWSHHFSFIPPPFHPTPTGLDLQMAIVDNNPTNPAPTNPTKKGKKKSPRAAAAPEKMPTPAEPPVPVASAVLEKEEEETSAAAEATIAPEEEADAGAGLPYVAQVAADTTSMVLAESYLLTQRGYETLKAIDARVGVSTRLFALDESIGVSKKVIATVEALTTRAQALDTKYKVVSTIKDTAEAVSERALEYKYVDSGAKLVESWGRSTLAKARRKIATRSSKGGKEAKTSVSPVPLTGEEEVPIDLTKK